MELHGSEPAPEDHAEALLRRYPEVPDSGSLSADVSVLGQTAYLTVIPVDGDGVLVEGGITAQSERVLELLDNELDRVGSSSDLVAHLTIYLCDIQRNRDAFNQVYRRWFSGPNLPVRCAVGVAELGRPGMLVELTVVAGVP